MSRRPRGLGQNRDLSRRSGSNPRPNLRWLTAPGEYGCEPNDSRASPLSASFGSRFRGLRTLWAAVPEVVEGVVRAATRRDAAVVVYDRNEPEERAASGRRIHEEAVLAIGFPFLPDHPALLDGDL